MLRLIHSFDVKPGAGRVVHRGLEHELWARSEPFGCVERKMWIYLDGIDGTYEHGKPARRPRYLNEAFWPHHQSAENFRKWLLSDEAASFAAAGSTASSTTPSCATSTTAHTIRSAKSRPIPFREFGFQPPLRPGHHVNAFRDNC